LEEAFSAQKRAPSPFYKSKTGTELVFGAGGLGSFRMGAKSVNGRAGGAVMVCVFVFSSSQQVSVHNNLHLQVDRAPVRRLARTKPQPRVKNAEDFSGLS
jgi:hypothetical protein